MLTNSGFSGTIRGSSASYVVVISVQHIYSFKTEKLHLPNIFQVKDQHHLHVGQGDHFLDNKNNDNW